MVVLFVQNNVVRISEANANSEALPKNKTGHIQSRHVKESVILLQEKNSCISHTRVLCISVFENSHVARILFAKYGTIDKQVHKFEKELLVNSIMGRHFKPEISGDSWINLIAPWIKFDSLIREFRSFVRDGSIDHGLNQFLKIYCWHVEEW